MSVASAVLVYDTPFGTDAVERSPNDLARRAAVHAYYSAARLRKFWPKHKVVPTLEALVRQKVL